jgi:hypothetical protein
MFKAKILIFSAAIGVFILLGVHCTKPRSNPLDPKGDSYDSQMVNDLIIKERPISVTFTPLNMTADSTFLSDTVRFSLATDLSGKVLEYQYAVNPDIWTAWAANENFVGYLDDGSYNLAVRFRIAGTDTFQTASVHFEVQALAGPTIYISPRTTLLPTTGTPASVWITIRARQLPQARLMHFKLLNAQVVSAGAPGGDSVAAFNTENSVEVIYMRNTNQPADYEAISLEINTAALNDTMRVELQECLARDSANVDITGYTVRGGLIVKGGE